MDVYGIERRRENEQIDVPRRDIMYLIHYTDQGAFYYTFRRVLHLISVHIYKIR